MKTCSKCNQSKDLIHFTKHKGYKDGYSSWCKLCHNAVCASERHRQMCRDRKLKLRACPVYKAFEKFMYDQRRRKTWKQAIFSGLKSRAAKRGIEFTISVNDIPEPTNLCPILQVPMVLNGKYSPSVDRIDNTLGYVPGNIQVISRFANSMKNAATKEELIQFSKFWVNYYS